MNIIAVAGPKFIYIIIRTHLSQMHTNGKRCSPLSYERASIWVNKLTYRQTKFLIGSVAFLCSYILSYDSLLARGEDEFELFQRIDLIREQERHARWVASGCPGGKMPPRLMQDREEMPE
jgi:hypothetical protein